LVASQLEGNDNLSFCLPGYEGDAAKTRGSAFANCSRCLGARIGSPGAQGRISAPARENRACWGLWSMQLRMPVPPRAWSI